MSIVAAYALPHPPLLLPEVGQGEERKLQLTQNAYERAMKEAAELAPETVIVVSPHTVMYADYFHIAPGEMASGDFAAFGAPDLRVMADYDEPFAKELAKAASAEGIAAGGVGGRGAALDHGVMVPLSFLEAHTADFRLVRVGVSGLSPKEHYVFGRCIARVAEELGRRAVFFASGDLSHRLTPDAPRGFAPEGPRFDKACMKYLEEGDFLKLLRMEAALYQPATECALRGLWMLAGVLDARALKIKKLSYQGTTGVGYGLVSFKVTREDPRRSFVERYEMLERRAREERRAAEDDYVRLARRAMETIVRTGKLPPVPAELPEEMMGRAGVYVTLTRDGTPRGTYGTFEPSAKSIADEITRNAAHAARNDTHIAPVTEEELDALDITVDVLSEPELVGSADALDPKTYGIIAESRGRKGVMLPAAPGIETAEEQLRAARKKAGIPEDAAIRIWRFTSERHA